MNARKSRWLAKNSFLLAPDSYWTAIDEWIENNTGGCGPGKVGDYFVPDLMLLLNVKPACQIHDYQYVKSDIVDWMKLMPRLQKCGPHGQRAIDMFCRAEDVPGPKKNADLTFLVNLFWYIQFNSRHWDWLIEKRRERAWLYFVAVWSCDSFYGGEK